jgi:hypothetical protein
MVGGKPHPTTLVFASSYNRRDTNPYPKEGQAQLAGPGDLPVHVRSGHGTTITYLGDSVKERLIFSLFSKEKCLLIEMSLAKIRGMSHKPKVRSI